MLRKLEENVEAEMASYGEQLDQAQVELKKVCIRRRESQNPQLPSRNVRVRIDRFRDGNWNGPRSDPD